MSSEHHHQSSLSNPFTAPGVTGSASQPTSPRQTIGTLATPHETTSTSNTSTSTAHMTTSFTLPSRDHEAASEQTRADDPMPQTSSSVHHTRGNLHKRRASASPEKFNKGHFEPLTIRTDLPLPAREPPAKKSRTEKSEKKIEIYYDSLGTPKIREIPASIEAGFSPTTAIFSHDVRKTAPLPRSPTPPRGTVPSGHVIAATRLLNGAPSTAARQTQPQARKKKPFNMIDAFVRNDALCMELVSYLPMPALISLYAISKYFHWKFNKEATAYIMASVRTWAPFADQIFPWRCYAPLCIKDPIKRQKSSAVMARGGPDADADYTALAQGSRDVPSMRWLQMVVYRHKVAQDLVISLLHRGLRVDPAASNAVKVSFVSIIRLPNLTDLIPSGCGSSWTCPTTTTA